MKGTKKSTSMLSMCASLRLASASFAAVAPSAGAALATAIVCDEWTPAADGEGEGGGMEEPRRLHPLRLAPARGDWMVPENTLNLASSFLDAKRLFLR